MDIQSTAKTEVSTRSHQLNTNILIVYECISVRTEITKNKDFWTSVEAKVHSVGDSVNW